MDKVSVKPINTIKSILLASLFPEERLDTDTVICRHNHERPACGRRTVGRGSGQRERENVGHTNGEMRTGLISAERTRDGGSDETENEIPIFSSNRWMNSKRPGGQL